jgi:hypothetical protein
MRLAFLLTLFLTPNAWADADCSPNATAAQIEAAKAKTLADPDLKSTIIEHDYQKLTIQKPDGSLVLSYFTLPSHPAHPSNVLTAIYEAEGQIWAYSKGFTAGNCSVFGEWIKQFEKQHEALRQSFKKRGS